MSAVDDLASALRPWDGRWFIAKPAGLEMRFYTPAQFTAKQLLAYGHRLTNWQAHICQIVLTQEKPPSPLQSHWLDRISGDLEGRRAA